MKEHLITALKCLRESGWQDAYTLTAIEEIKLCLIETYKTRSSSPKYPNHRYVPERRSHERRNQSSVTSPSVSS